MQSSRPPDDRSTYCSAQVEVSREELRRGGVEGLTVGMPVEVIIVTRERTMIDYLLQPIKDAIWRAGREV